MTTRAGIVISAILFASQASAETPDPKPGHAPATVSVDVLRHPITAKVRRMLLAAMEKMKAGEHKAAIEQLQETLAKYPDSAPYVQDLLGVEYIKTDQYAAAVHSFEQAVALLPRDAMTHYSFGLSLVCAGDYDRAEQEVRRALELDPGNEQIRTWLNTLVERSRSGN